MAIGGAPAGVVAVTDTLTEESASAIAALERPKHRTVAPSNTASAG